MPWVPVEMKRFSFSVPKSELSDVEACIEQWRNSGLGNTKRVEISRGVRGWSLKMPLLDVDPFCAFATSPLSPFTRRRLYTSASAFLEATGLAWNLMDGPELAVTPLSAAETWSAADELRPV